MKLFEMEVPEVYDGIVEIINATREPGKRAKVAVYTADSDVDPVGACVGMRGSRVQSIVSELRGEKIDIVRWSEDLPTYLENAMSPAEIERMEIDKEQREINVWVDQDQLSLAIGRQGQNVRLASKLIGYKINASPLEERSSISIEDQIALELGKDRSAEEEVSGEVVEPTSEVTEEETASDEVAKPTSEVTEEETASDEVAKPTSEVAEEETTSDEVVEPTSEVTEEETTSDEVVEPTSEVTEEETTSNEVAKPTSEVAEEETVSNEGTEEVVAEETTEPVSSEEAKKETVEEVVSKEPVEDKAV